MNVDMLAILRDHGIKTADRRDKHTTAGWLNLRCPFCDDDGDHHLGWNIGGQRFNCWRCGYHGVDDTLAALLGVDHNEVFAVKNRYALRPGSLLVEDHPVVHADHVIVPGGDLQHLHLDYLRGRDYDPRQLLRWQLQGTDHLSRGREKFRIFCPIYYDGRVVSWQGRDVSGKSDLRWYSCPQEKEVRPHKHCLGGEQLVPGDSVAVVEGFTDAWRLGPGSVCTFGTDYLAAQVLLLKRYRRRFIVLDAEAKDPNARLQADKLCYQLSAFPGETLLVELDGEDPGALPQAEADYLMEKEWRIR